MWRGDGQMGLDPEAQPLGVNDWDVMPFNAEQHFGLTWILRRFNRLSRFQRTCLYLVTFIAILGSTYFHIKNNELTIIEINITNPPQEEANEYEERVQGAPRKLEKQREEEPMERPVFTGPTNDRQSAVVKAYKHAWKGYKKHAWGHDNLRPVSGTATDWFTLGLTIIDSMDTAYIMGLHEEYEEAKRWVKEELVFTRNKDVNFFEVTIRVLGSLLTNYHFTHDEMFLEKASVVASIPRIYEAINLILISSNAAVVDLEQQELGERLMAAFSSPSGIPYSDVNLGARTAHAPEWSHYSTTAEVSTIQLEFRELSRATGNPAYEDAAAAVSEKLHQLPKKRGLVPIFINPNSGHFLPHATITLGARGDSYYEYLLKQWLQTGKTVNYFFDDYQLAVEGIQEFLARRSSPNKLLFIGELAAGSESFTAKMDHLTCFLPGTLALGHANGLPDWHMTMAEELLYTCYQTYAKQITFLAPEITHFNMAPGSTEDMYVKTADSHNLLRPEFVESLWYMYQITGNTTYQEWGWEVFQAIEKYARVENGYTSISNVKMEEPGNRDMMESFFLSETLKYLYLLFSEDRYLIDLNKYVINSEAHPLPIHNN